MSKFRDTFYNEIKKGLIGTGSDVFGVSDSEELISDYPLNRYYSGILFPSKDFPTGSAKSEEEIESSSNEADTNEEDYDNAIDADEEPAGDSKEKDQKINEDLEHEKNQDNGSQTESKETDFVALDTEDFQLTQNAFFPTHIGFTFCIDPKKSIKVNFSFGIFDQLEQPSRKLKFAISKEGFQTFFDSTIETQLSLKHSYLQ